MEASLAARLTVPHDRATDWGTRSPITYGDFGSISYAFEHAGNSFHPSYPDTVPAMHERNRPALMLLCEEVALEPSQRTLDRELAAVLPGRGRARRGRRGAHRQDLRDAAVAPGGDGVARDLVIARGQVLDVGAIQVG